VGGASWTTAMLASTLTQTIADSEVLNEASRIALEVDFAFAIGTALFQFLSLKTSPDTAVSSFFGLVSGALSPVAPGRGLRRRGAARRRWGSYAALQTRQARVKEQGFPGKGPRRRRGASASVLA
jgi:hypothetical protein